MKRQRNDHTTTVEDELAARRQRKREARPTLSQIRRLIVADELRKRSKQRELF